MQQLRLTESEPVSASAQQEGDAALGSASQRPDAPAAESRVDGKAAVPQRGLAAELRVLKVRKSPET